jgi:hypothetical protein
LGLFLVIRCVRLPIHYLHRFAFFNLDPSSCSDCNLLFRFLSTILTHQLLFFALIPSVCSQEYRPCCPQVAAIRNLSVGRPGELLNRLGPFAYSALTHFFRGILVSFSSAQTTQNVTLLCFEWCQTASPRFLVDIPRASLRVYIPSCISQIVP